NVNFEILLSSQRAVKPRTMYKNPYIISSSQLPNQPLDFDLTFFDDLRIYSHPGLPVYTAQFADVKLALLGYIINPFAPEDGNLAIIKKLAAHCATTDDFFRETTKYSGRYVLLYKNDSSFVVTGDACHLRQIYYSIGEGDLL